MESTDIIRVILPYAVAFALTHLIVLPFKSFFLTGPIRQTAVRATIWNVAAVAYTVVVMLIFGLESQSVTSGLLKFLPALLVFTVSIGVWLYIMVSATRKYMLIDVAVFTILALAAS